MSAKRPDRKRRHRTNYNEPGHAHVLTFSCYHGFEFLKAERTCVWLAESLEAARAEWDFSLWAYVFMPEHVHLVIYPRRLVYDIADIRQAIKEPVARKGDRVSRIARPGMAAADHSCQGESHPPLLLAEGGGYDRNIDNARTLLAEIEYIHMNPVRRGLVERAVDWRWSSAAWMLGVGDSPVKLDRIPPEWLLTEP